MEINLKGKEISEQLLTVALLKDLGDYSIIKISFRKEARDYIAINAFIKSAQLKHSVMVLQGIYSPRTEILSYKYVLIGEKEARQLVDLFIDGNVKEDIEGDRA